MLKLNKEICQKCLDSEYPTGWDESDEEEWNYVIYSNVKNTWCGCGDPINGPNENCPYQLEHIVSKEA